MSPPLPADPGLSRSPGERLSIAVPYQLSLVSRVKTVESRVMVGVAVGVEHECEEQFDPAAKLEDHAAQADHFGGDVAEAVHAEQLVVVGAEHELQQSALSGDRPACGGGKVGAAQRLRDADDLDVFLGRTDASGFGAVAVALPAFRRGCCHFSVRVRPLLASVPISA